MTSREIIKLSILGSWLLKPATLSCNFVLGFISLQIIKIVRKVFAFSSLYAY